MCSIELTAAKAHRNENISHCLIATCGIITALIPIIIGLFLLIKGSATFFSFSHSINEFIFSGIWKPSDSLEGGGQVGAAMFIIGSLWTCLLALVFTIPFSLTTGIFMTEISSPHLHRFIQPAIELFTGIPSVIYGWIGLTVLIPFMKDFLHIPMPRGFSILAAAIVLSIMIFPTITTMAADAMLAVPKAWREASYGLGATRWETIWHVVLPAARNGIFTGIILGLARALGEALAVAMVIGQMKKMPASILDPASTLTTVIASDMGGAMDGGEFSAALWSMALLLFIISFIFIFIIHRISANTQKEAQA
jgi:phosphate transport system permease protein